MMLVSKINKNYKPDSKFDTTKIDYLNNKYIQLTGEQIKNRMDNFMKWFKHIVDLIDSPTSNILKDIFNNEF